MSTDGPVPVVSLFAPWPPYREWVHGMTPAQLCATDVVIPGSNWVSLSGRRRHYVATAPCPHCGYIADVSMWEMPGQRPDDEFPEHGHPPLPMALFAMKCLSGLCDHRNAGVLHPCASSARAAWNKRDMGAIIFSLGQFDAEQLRDLAVAASERARATLVVVEETA